jgi:hypothetical protein
VFSVWYELSVVPIELVFGNEHEGRFCPAGNKKDKCYFALNVMEL